MIIMLFLFKAQGIDGPTIRTAGWSKKTAREHFLTRMTSENRKVKGERGKIVHPKKKNYQTRGSQPSEDKGGMMTANRNP